MEKNHKSQLMRLFSDLDFVLSSEPVPDSRKLTAERINRLLGIRLEDQLFMIGTDCDNVLEAIKLNERVRTHIQGIHELPNGRQVAFALSKSPLTAQEKSYDYTWIVVKEGIVPMHQVTILEGMSSWRRFFGVMDKLLPEPLEKGADKTRLRDLFRED